MKKEASRFKKRDMHDACSAENASSYYFIMSWGFTSVHVSTTCFILLLHTSYSMCMYLYSACFSGSYIHLMSTTQLDRSRSPTMPCILLSCPLHSWMLPLANNAMHSPSSYTSHVHYAVGSLPLANNAMHSPSWRAGASQPSRTAGSDFSIMCAAHKTRA